MTLGYISGITCKGKPVLWRQNDNGTYQCLFTIEYDNEQKKLAESESAAIGKLIQQRFNLPEAKVDTNTCIDESDLKHGNSGFIPKIDSTTTHQQYQDMKSSTSSPSSSKKPARKNSTEEVGQSSNTPPGFFNKNALPGKQIILSNIITDPVTIRKTTCFDDGFVRNNRKNFSVIKSAPILTQAHVSALLTLTASDWILKLRKEQAKLLKIYSITLQKFAIKK